MCEGSGQELKLVLGLWSMWAPTQFSRALGKLRQPSGSCRAPVLGPGMVATATGDPEGGCTKQGQGSQRPGHLGRGRPTQPFCRPSARGFRKGLEVLHPTQSPGPGLRAPRELRTSGDREGGWRHSPGSRKPPPSPDVWLSLPEAWELGWGLASAEPLYSAGARAGA